jgi:DNA-binding transcriptional MerR regulator
MDQERFSIGELAQAAATTARTIRFYTAEGLLPPPLTEGRNAIYSEAHRRRLRLIQRLKAAYLPLSAIKEQLAGLTDEQVDVLLERSGPHRVENTGAGTSAVRSRAAAMPAESAAVAYVARILEAADQALAAGSSESEEGRQSRRVLLISPALRPDGNSGSVTNGVPGADSGVSERWERITLRPGIEIHIRESMSREYRDELSRLVQLARALFPDSSS